MNKMFSIKLLKCLAIFSLLGAVSVSYAQAQGRGGAEGSGPRK